MVHVSGCIRMHTVCCGVHTYDVSVRSISVRRTDVCLTIHPSSHGAFTSAAKTSLLSSRDATSSMLAVGAILGVLAIMIGGDDTYCSRWKPRIQFCSSLSQNDLVDPIPDD